MSRPSRRLLLALSTVLSFGLVASALAAGPAARADDVSLSFVPKSASSLLVLDVKGAASNPFIKGLRKELIDLAGAGRDVARLKREAGVDVFADIDRIVYAGTDKAVRKAGDSVLILAGRFDTAKLAAFYAKRGDTAPTQESWKGHDVHVIGASSWLVVKDGHAIVGTKDLVMEALEARASGAKLPGGALAGALPAAGLRKHAWGAIVGSGDLQKVLGKGFGAFKGVKEAGFGLDLSSGLSLTVAGLFPDAAASGKAEAEVAETVKGFASDPEVAELGLSALFDAFAATRSGQRLELKVALPAAKATELAANLKALFE